MSNKLEINRDRLFTNGYRKYLQSLTHGALVDFILTGSNLSFTPAQERSLLLEELEDQQGRNARATAKINELVTENRQLRAKIESSQPVNTAGGFSAMVGDENGVPTFRVRVIDLDTNTVLHEGSLGGSDDFAKDLISLIFGGVLGNTPVEAKRVYTSFAEYTTDFPNAVAVASIGAADTVLSEGVINACDDLMDHFEPYVEAGALAHGVGIVQIACRDQATGDAFVDAAIAIGVNPVTFATYVLNHCN